MLEQSYMDEKNKLVWKLFHNLNKANIELIEKHLDKRIYSSELAFILIREHIFISRQFRLVDILFSENKQLNDTDHAFILISLCRNIIENLAKVVYFFHEDGIDLQLKIDTWKKYCNKAKQWITENYSNYNDMTGEQISEAINKYFETEKSTMTVWCAVDKKRLGSTSALIEEVFGKSLLQCWKDSSKLLHANPFYRHYYFTSSDNSAGINLKSLTRTWVPLFSAIVNWHIYFLEKLSDLIDNQDFKNDLNAALQSPEIKYYFEHLKLLDKNVDV